MATETITAVQKKRYKMQQQCLIAKAAILLDKPESKIKKVVENDHGCIVEYKSQSWGGTSIPFEVWVLGYTDSEYCDFRFKGITPAGK